MKRHQECFPLSPHIITKFWEFQSLEYNPFKFNHFSKFLSKSLHIDFTLEVLHTLHPLIIHFTEAKEKNIVCNIF